MTVDYVMLENVPEAWTHQQYHVRQYRPNYFSGFENEVVRDVAFDDILKCSWFKNFEQHGFEHFSFCQYGDELLISAHYENGEHWVAGFAIPIDKPLAADWRYSGDKIMKLDE